MNSNNRRHTPKAVELSVLSRSKRRCALCFALAGDLTEKQGQIAHLDHNPADWAEDNLAFLCLNHHSVYDSTTSQHKNYTLAEVKKARNDLYAAVQRDQHTPAPPNEYQTQSEESLTSRHTKWYKDKKYLVASIILLFILAIFGWIYHNSSRTESITNAPQNAGIVTQGQTGNNIINIPSEPHKDVSLFVKCELSSYPTSFPNDGTIYAIVMYSANQPSGIAKLFAPANTPFKMLEGRDWLQTYRCEAVNYGTVPLFNVTMELALRYLEAVDTSNHSQTAGKEINAIDSRGECAAR